MKKQMNALLSFLFVVLAFSAFSQTRTVSGNVTDESGEPAIAATVKVTGTTLGTVTNGEGDFTINDVPTNAQTLTISSIGYSDKVVAISDFVNAVLSGEDAMIEDVVVNALGIEVSKSQIASSVSKVTGTEIQGSGETSVITGLSGKAAGVNITRSSGDPGAGAYIQLRGPNSITRSNQPLIVVDGMPYYNSEIGSGTAGTTQQSRLNDLNPDDIASVQVMKGASASALWGSRAGNGVIVITTKQGQENGKANVRYSYRKSFDKVNKFYDLQDTYGKGSGGKWSGGFGSGSWGDKISSRSGGADEVDKTKGYFEAANGTKYYPIIKKNSRDNFQQRNIDQVINNGTFDQHAFTISGGRASTSYYFNMTHLKQDGIVQSNSDYDRLNLRMNVKSELTKKLSAKTNIAYTKTTSNRTQQGSNLRGLLLGLLRNPADFDISDYTGTYYTASGGVIPNRHRAYRVQLGQIANPIYNNPLWTVNKQRDDNSVHRIVGITSFTYEPAKWLDLIGRAGVDTYTDLREGSYPLYSGSAVNGAAGASQVRETQFNGDLIAVANFDLAEKIGSEFTAGINLNSRNRETFGTSYTNFDINTPKFVIANTETANLSPGRRELRRRTAASYLQAAFDLDDKLFLTFTGRAENASTFGDSKKTVFYPSAEFGYFFSDDLGVDALTNAKLRLTYGEVGIEPAAYSTDTYLSPSVYQSSWGPRSEASSYAGSFARGDVLGNPNLEPERVKSYEAGLDLGFVEDRFNVGFTYYNTKTTDALFSVDLAPSSGFAAEYKNAAKMENKGVEIETSLDVLRKDDLNVNLFGNFAKNNNKVVDLVGTTSIFLNGFTGTSSRAVEGQPLGTLWGGRWARVDQDNPNSDLVLDANGFPTIATTEGILGNPIPDWRGSAGSKIDYKGFDLNVLFEHSEGGDLWDGTNGALTVFGRPKYTANEVTLSAADAEKIKTLNGKTIAEQYTANTDGSYTFRGDLKDFGAGDVALDESWYSTRGGGFGGPGEQFIKDGTWTRLRELSLGYKFPSKLFKNNFLSNAKITLTGRNLLLWSKTDFGIDPETNLTGASNGRGLIYFQNPNTKSFLINIDLGL